MAERSERSLITCASKAPPLRRRALAVLANEDVGGAVDVAVKDHCQKLEPGYSIGLSTEFTPAELNCLRLAIVGTGVSVLSHLNAMPPQTDQRKSVSPSAFVHRSITISIMVLIA